MDWLAEPPSSLSLGCQIKGNHCETLRGGACFACNPRGDPLFNLTSPFPRSVMFHVHTNGHRFEGGNLQKWDRKERNIEQNQLNCTLKRLMSTSHPPAATAPSARRCAKLHDCVFWQLLKIKLIIVGDYNYLNHDIQPFCLHFARVVRWNSVRFTRRGRSIGGHAFNVSTLIARRRREGT